MVILVTAMMTRTKGLSELVAGIVYLVSFTVHGAKNGRRLQELGWHGMAWHGMAWHRRKTLTSMMVGLYIVCAAEPTSYTRYIVYIGWPGQTERSDATMNLQILIKT